MRFLKKIAFIILYISFVALGNAQENKNTGFTHDSLKFLDEVAVYLNTGLADKSDVKDFMKQFTISWHSAAYNSYYKQNTYQFADEMLAKKMPVYPTLQLLLTAMQNFVKSGLPQEKFDQWDSCLEKQMKHKPYANVNTYLTVCGNLFGKGVLFESPTVIWSTNNSDYEFNCDSVQ